MLSVAFVCATARAAAPCDFKGLAVGDEATPQQIMKHFDVEKYKDADEPETQAQRDARFSAWQKRVEEVGSSNALEEDDWNRGPACGHNFCMIPFGVDVGNGAFPTQVGLITFFDKAGTITGIDISYDSFEWDEVLEIVNNKYGDSWRKEEIPEVITNYATKKSELETMIVLTHRGQGVNPNTGDKCTIMMRSRDLMFVHSMPPPNRAIMERKLVSKSF